MTIAKATLTHGLIFGLAVILTGTTAQAGLYRHIDDHSRDIERDAERAEAIVKYNFNHAPQSIVRYLSDELHGVAQSAHRLHELTECSGNVLAIDALTSQLDGQFRHVQEGVLVMREWVEGRNCSVHRFSSCFRTARPRSVDRANLASLCRRIDDIEKELCEMKEDLQVVLTDYYRSRRHTSNWRGASSGRDVTPALQSRYEPSRRIVPLGTYNRPGHGSSHDHGFNQGRGISNRDSHSHRPSNYSFGNRGSRYSRFSDSSYVHTRIGGFGLSFRLK